MITNAQSGTGIEQVSDDLYRINTPIRFPDGQAFSFNQYLLVDDAPLLFHTGPRRMFGLVSEAVGHVLPLTKLRYIGLSHVESDECGALNEFLAVAPQATPLCGRIAAMVSINDLADRPARALADGEQLSLGRHTLRWFDTPHTPHGWDCGMMIDLTTQALFCSDLFTQPGRGDKALVDSDILGPSEAFRKPMDYYAHAPDTAATLERLAAAQPRTLACMHGSAWQGDGGALLRELARAVCAKA